MSSTHRTALDDLQRQVDCMVPNRNGPESLFIMTTDGRRQPYRTLSMTMNDGGSFLPPMMAGALAGALHTTTESPINMDKTLYWRERPHFQTDLDGTQILTCRYTIVDGPHELKHG